jgi:lipoyl(octanoyl) transferase
MTDIVTVRRFPRVAYEPCWQAMKAFTEQRDDNTPDELWALEHPPVFTLGQAGKPEHVLAPGEIPVVQCDRGGQVTYHGPGQTVIYLMLDLKRHGIGARELVTRIENAIVAMLAARGIDAWPKKEAPGVYTEQGKIASLGLRIRRGRSYHGLALNRDLDVEDIFRRINPCGHVGQPVTTLARLGTDASARGVEDDLIAALTERFPGTRLEEASALPDWYNASHDNASLEHS